MRAKQSKFSQDDGGNIGVRGDLLRAENSRAAETRKHHLSTCGVLARSPTTQFRTGKAIGGREISKCLLDWIETGYTLIGRHPELPAIVFEHAAHGVAAQPVATGKDGDLSALWVELVKTVLSA